ncbi:MAG: DUF4124 domain-containing protein [Xanthomonadaceae bacterium]|nr:DUF4124 domain-containing protein [Xanthomonadaceae bacterium]
MRWGWAIAIGILAGGGTAWWFSHGPSKQTREETDRLAAERAEQLLCPLHRWRDEAGVLQITEQPPPGGRPYERIAVHGTQGIRVCSRHPSSDR